MRTLSGGLTAAQQSDSASPYVTVETILGVGSWTFTSNDRLYSIEHREEPYGGKATIRLKNHDKWFAGKDLRGWEVKIGYGYGSEVSYVAPMWVLVQHDSSVEGQLLTELECVDFWQKLAWFGVGPDPNTGDIVYAPAWDRNLTIRQIINTVLGQVDSTPAVGDVIVDSNDGIIDVFKPYYETQMNLPVRKIIREMLEMTKSGMRMRQDGMHILYLNPADTPSYYYDSVHNFLTEVRQKALVLPNWVIFVDHYPTEEEAEAYKGEAKDLESIARIGNVILVKKPAEYVGVASDAEATQLADSYLARVDAEVNQGRIIVPHNCGQEIYDQIQVNDSRAGILFEGRIGGLIHRWSCGESQSRPGSTAEGLHPYTLEIRLGGLVEAVTTTGPDELISDLWGLSKLHEWPFGQTGDMISESSLPRADRNWQTNLIFYPGDSSDSNKHNAVHWDAGSIFWPDGFTISVNPGEVTGIIIGQRLYIYWDLTVGDPENLRSTYVLDDIIHPKRGLLATVSATIEGGIVTITVPGSHGATQVGGLPDGVVVTEDLVDAAVTAAKLGDGSVVTDKVANSAISSAKIANVAVLTQHMQDAIVTKDKLQDQAVTHDKIIANAIYGYHVTANAIATDHLVSGAISADKIAANAVVAHLIAGENVLGNIALFNIVRAAHIDAGAITADKIDVLDLSSISANIGTITAGRITGDLDGVRWRGYIYMEDSFGTVYGYIGPEPAGRFAVRSFGKWPILLVTGSQAQAVFVAPNDQWGPISDGATTWRFRTWNIAGSSPVHHAFCPSADGCGEMGRVGNLWWRVASQNLYVQSPPWQGHDDVGLIRSIKAKKVKGLRDRRTRDEVIDPQSLPPEMRYEGDAGDGQDSLLEVGNMIGLTAGAVAQLAEKVERIERRLGI